MPWKARTSHIGRCTLAKLLTAGGLLASGVLGFASVPANISAASGNGQTAKVLTPFVFPLVATVTDSSDTPVAGVTVTFTGPGINTATGTTDANGKASATLTANTYLGGYTVSASTDGVRNPAIFTQTNTLTTPCRQSIAVNKTNDDGTAGTLREAIADVCPGGTVDLSGLPDGTTLTVTNRIYLDQDVTIQGPAGATVTVSGGGTTRIFFAQSGNIAIKNLTLTNGFGKGGDSRIGGGGAGMGGAIFQNGGSLQISYVVFTGNRAQGGSSGNSAFGDGGGGFGGDAPSSGTGANGGDLGGLGGSSIGNLAGGPGAGGYGFAGIGGFGGGGGGSAFGTGIPSDGGFGGGGGLAGIPGFGGGSGGFKAGGGGAGFGGAIFVYSGTLALVNDQFLNNSADGGTGPQDSASQNGQGKGGAIFIYPDAGAIASLTGTSFSGNFAPQTAPACPGEDDADICGNVLQIRNSGAPLLGQPFTVSGNSNETISVTGLCSADKGSVILNAVSSPTCVVTASLNGASVSATIGVVLGATTRTIPLPITTASAQSAFTFTISQASNGASGTWQVNRQYPTPTITGNTATVSTVAGYAYSPLLTLNSTPGTFSVTTSDGSTFWVFSRGCTQNRVGVGGLLQAVVFNSCAGSTIDLTRLTGTITVSSRMRVDDDMTIVGPGPEKLAIDGGGRTRLFFIGNGNVTIKNLTLSNGYAKGGDSTDGGAAAGMGGAIFQNGGDLQISNVVFTGNKAQGGSTAPGHGFGGGGFFEDAPISGVGADGGDLGGVGGSSLTTPNGGPGAGGYVYQGSGGFGAGGGVGGNSGFGAGGGEDSVGGLGGGSGSDAHGGGGGAAFGGAVFVYSGTLELINDQFLNNSADSGRSSAGDQYDGQAKGGAIFIYADAGATAALTGTSFSGNSAPSQGKGFIGQNNSGGNTNYATGGACPGSDDNDICGVVTEDITVTTNIPGLTFNADGALSSSPLTRQWTIGTSHTLSVNSPQTGSGGVQYFFSRWSDGSTDQTHQVTVSAATTAYTAIFQTSSSALFTSAPNGATLRNDFAGFVGMKFTTGALPVNVTALGRIYISGNNQTHIVKLVDARTGLDVPNGSVSLGLTAGTTNTYQYAPLTNAITLLPNTSYYLLTREFVGGDKWYDLAQVAANSALTVNGAEYQSSTGLYVAQVAGTWAYGPPSMQFVTGTIVPPPTVSIIAPLNNAAAQGQISLVATATAATGLTIQSVQFKLNGDNFGQPLTGSGPNYQVLLDTTTLLSAINAVTAVATDSNGGTTTAAPVTFTVANAPTALSPFITSAPRGVQRSDFTGFVGFRFMVGSTPVAVTQLGRWVVAGNSGTHTVKLVNADGSDLAGGSVSLSSAGASPGQYAYAQLIASNGKPTVIRLAPNTTYYLVSQEIAGGDQWYDVGPVSVDASGGSVDWAVYQQGNGPYIVLQTGSNSYVTPNFLFQTGSSNGGPPTVVINAPPNQSTVSEIVPLSAAATPATTCHITGVQFLFNGANVGTGTLTSQANTYSYSWDTRSISNITATLLAVATDDCGNTGTSQSVTVTVNNGAAPAGSPFVTSAPENTTTLRNDYQGYVGMKFTTSATPLVVSQLGRWMVAGNAGTHTVKLVDANGVDVQGGSIALNLSGKTAGQYVYAALAAPVTLLANTSYSILSQEFTGGDQWYDYSPVTVSSGVVNSPVYTLTNGVLIALSPSSRSYVPPNFLYTAGTNGGPTVVITSPSDGQGVSGNSIPLSAKATAAPGLSIVNQQFKLNGNFVTSPLDTTTLADGAYKLIAMATDSAENTGSSVPVTINVNNGNGGQSSGTALLSGAPTSGLRNDYAGYVGMKFTVGATALNVTKLGRWIAVPTTAAHTLKLVGAGTNSDVATVTLQPGQTAGGFAYATLASPVTLVAGSSYYLLTQEAAGGDQWYDAGSVTANPAVTVKGPAYQQTNGAYVLLYAGGAAYGTVSAVF